MRTNRSEPVYPKLVRAFLLLAGVLVLSGCTEAMRQAGTATTPAEPDTERIEEDRVQIRRVLDQLIDADNAGDIEAAMEVYADDAVLFPPGEPPVRGKRRIRARYEDLFSRTVARLRATSHETEAEETWAFDRGQVDGLIYDKTDFEEDLEEARPLRIVSDQYVMILRRELNGDPETDESRWRITRLMWNPTGEGRP